MMRKVCLLTKERGIKTLVKLNPVMTDCMGMCGSCRVKVGGKIVLACIEGPEFDGHQVDFADLDIRMNAYEESEEWDNRRLTRNLKRNGSTTLARFLSGILKN
jgi:ferredoxin--NADP+ reductase